MRFWHGTVAHLVGCGVRVDGRALQGGPYGARPAGHPRRPRPLDQVPVPHQRDDRYEEWTVSDLAVTMFTT